MGEVGGLVRGVVELAALDGGAAQGDGYLVRHFHELLVELGVGDVAGDALGAGGVGLHVAAQAFQFEAGVVHLPWW
ncbi:hypothetical protein [Streptomyces sp. NPDC002922]|uniref:hypothetical protein n=1 Tax=Streptomyces sp. NPDC002922 TaxID=3154439 RepID=UPI0033B9BB3C